MIEALLGLDVGTSATKAVLFDLSGVELARSVSPTYYLHTPNPGWVEQDPEDLWAAVHGAIRDVMAQVGPDVQTLAVGMAAQSGSVLPASADGKPIGRLITWMDGRTENLVREWRSGEIKGLVKSTSGWALYPGLPLPTIVWLRQNDAKTYSETRHYFSVNDFIAYRLTGELCTNPSNGGGMQLVDIQTGQWSDALCALAGITPEFLSEIQPSGQTIGAIKPEVIRSTRLSDSTVLVNGGHDQGCAALGLGINTPGKVLLASGTAWVVTGVVDSPGLAHVPDDLDINFHPAPGLWTISQSLGGLGASLEWWIKQAWKGIEALDDRQTIYESLNQELEKTEIGCDGLFFLPLTGGHDSPSTIQPGGFTGLRLSHTRGDMARAILESAAFELRWVLQRIQETGLPMECLWMVGGAAKSTHWPDILANVTGMPILLPQYDNWPAMGGAVLAGMGVGVFGSLDEALFHFQKGAQQIYPDTALVNRYGPVYEGYRDCWLSRV